MTDIMNRSTIILGNTLILLFNRRIVKNSKILTIFLYITCIICNITYLLGTYKHLHGFLEWIEFIVVGVYLVYYCFILAAGIIYLKKYGRNPKIPLMDNKGNLIGWLPSEREQFIKELRKAESGEAMSMLNLALFYKNGTGCRKNLKKAKRWTVKTSLYKTDIVWINEEARCLKLQIEDEIKADYQNAFDDIMDYIQNIFDI